MLVLIVGGIFLLSITIIVHEMGHLLMGKLVGIKAEIFSFGYGKGIWKKKIGDTTYQITAIPIGGYVKFYGDDYSLDYQNSSQNEGAFFSKPPLVRIIPVLGGPLFNLILGFLIFFILGFFSKTIPPYIQLWEEFTTSPALEGGLQNGDIVLSINNQPVKNFREMQEKILLSGGSSLEFEVKRSDKIQRFIVNPEIDPAGRAFIGIRVPGERYLQVDFPFFESLKYNIKKLLTSAEPPIPAMKYLQDGDIILEVEGQKIGSTIQLQKLLGGLNKEQIVLKIERQKYRLLIPWIKEIVEISVPYRKEYRINLIDVKDLDYQSIIGNIQLTSFQESDLRLLNFIKIENQSVESYEEIFYQFQNTNKFYEIQIKDKRYLAKIYPEKIGLIGFRPDNIILPFEVQESVSFMRALKKGLENTFLNIAIYPKFFEKLFMGRISFIDNTMGPVGMFAVAGMVLKTDFLSYIELIASLSIALAIINLIPFPIVDGGHIVLFLIEAILNRRLPLALIENLHKTAFILLLGLGFWIMFRDILFVLGL